MTNYYDEYQKHLRHKYGYYSFFILAFSLMINFVFDFQWGQTDELEVTLILMAVANYFLVMTVYHGSYFSKFESSIGFSILFFIIGGLNIRSSFSEYSEMIVDGQVTSDATLFVLGIGWLLIPITYSIKTIVEKKRNAQDI